MADFILSNSVTAGIRTEVSGIGASYFILPGVVYASMDSAVFADAASPGPVSSLVITNYGALLTGGAEAILLDTTDTSFLNNEVGASIGSSGFGTPTQATVLMNGGHNTINNAGTISTSSSANTIRMIGGHDSFNNQGTVSGAICGVQIDGGNLGFFNAGIISVAGPASLAAVRLNLGAGPNILTNTGEILALRGDAVVVTSDLPLTARALTISNSGTLRAQNGVAISTTDDVALTLHNSGRIEAAGGAATILAGDLADVVVNRGTILGAVHLGAGNDSIDSVGGHVQAVFGEAGNDSYLVSDALTQIYEGVGDGIDTVRATTDFTLRAEMGEIEKLTLLGSAQRGIGNDLANTITGNDLGNSLSGLGGIDQIFGGIGDDTLDGGGASDTMYGGAGDDVLIDALGVDFLYGDEGNDFLSSAGNSDRLYGGDGEDTLLGGVGADLLYGGLDADTFEFRRTIESTTTQRDQISGFENNIDLIDLSRIDAVQGVPGNQSFSYIGAAAFSNLAGELRFYLSGPHGRLAGDTNGDGIADFEVQLNAIATLSADSLIL